MRSQLNQYIPFDAVARWWYLLVAGPVAGLLFGLATAFKPFRPLATPVSEGGVPGSDPNTFVVWLAAPDWKDTVFFIVLGFLLACGMVWLDEEIHKHNEYKG